MARTELQWDGWQALDLKRKEFIIRQLARYFLSPLLYLDGIFPVEINELGERFETFDLLVSGEWLRFIPGMRNVSLGVTDQELAQQQDALRLVGATESEARAQLSDAVTVDILPMLVARNSVAANLRVIGQVNTLTHAFAGDAFAYSRVRDEVESLLSPQVTSPTDFAGLPPVLDSASLELRQFDSEHYQVAVKQDWDFVHLQRRLSGYGFSLPDEREYEYLMSGGLPGIFPWGVRHLQNQPHYLPNRFGLNVPVERQGGEIVMDDVVKSRQLAASQLPMGGLALSPYYRTRDGDFAKERYRKIVRVHLD